MRFSLLMAQVSRLRASTLVFLSFCGTAAIRSQVTTGLAVTQSPRLVQVWNDALTGLSWTSRDNGKDMSWKGAVNYCRKLKLGGYVDWRLASSFELQGIYDKTVEAAGRAGDTKGGVPRDFTWHVKGNLYLTGVEWSDDRTVRNGKPVGYAEHFDFNEGRLDNDPIGWPYPYNGLGALCVRGSGLSGTSRQQ